MPPRTETDFGSNCQVQNKFSPGGPHGGMKSSRGEIVHFTKCPSAQGLWEGHPGGPPGEKRDKTFQLDPCGCVSNFRPVLTVSCVKIGDLRKSCALPLEVPLKVAPPNF